MRVVCISDTHTMGRKVEVPDGDILIHAGDHTFTGTKNEIFDAFKWLEKLPHRHKVTIAGNHDLMFQNEPARALGIVRSIAPSVTYLQDSAVEIEGYKFYGSPWTPYFQGNHLYTWVFNLPQYDLDAAVAHWAKIPEDTDVLITHGPPRGFGDSNTKWYDTRKAFGDGRLLNRIFDTRTFLHVYGHIHGGYGVYPCNGRLFVNAAVNTEDYKPTNTPIIIDL